MCCACVQSSWGSFRKQKSAAGQGQSSSSAGASSQSKGAQGSAQGSGSGPSGAAAAPAPEGVEPKDFDSMPLKDLKKYLAGKGINTSGFLEKADFIAAAKQAAGVE